MKSACECMILPIVSPHPSELSVIVMVYRNRALNNMHLSINENHEE